MNERANGLPKPANMTEWGDLLTRCIENTKTMSPDASQTLLDEVIAVCPDGRGRGLNAALERQIEKLERLLPDNLKGQAERFVKIAMLTFERRAELKDCTSSSFLKCVFEAAQYGFAVDGRLFHAVKRNRNAGTHSEPNWISEASCMPDYKGLIAVAKRSGSILECEARVVGNGDEFSLWFQDGQTHMTHKPDLRTTVRADAFQGVYCRLWLGGTPGWVCEYMTADEIRGISGRSEAMKPRKGKEPTGPWVTDFFEMAKKTVLKRALKTRVDDPAFSQLLELDDREYERTPDPDAPIPTGTPVKPVDDSQMGRLTAALGEPESFVQGTDSAQETTEVEPQPSTVASPADEPEEPSEPTADDEAAFGDEVNLDNLNNSLSQATTAWEVDDIAAGYVGVFKSEEVKIRGRQAVLAAKSRCASAAPPPPAKSKGRKPAQKSMVETSPQYD